MVPHCAKQSSLIIINARDSECVLSEGFSPCSIGLDAYAIVIKQDIVEQHVVEQALTRGPGPKNRESSRARSHSLLQRLSSSNQKTSYQAPSFLKILCPPSSLELSTEILTHGPLEITPNTNIKYTQSIHVSKTQGLQNDNL